MAPSTAPLEVRKRPEKEEVTSPGLGVVGFCNDGPRGGGGPAVIRVGLAAVLDRRVDGVFYPLVCEVF